MLKITGKENIEKYIKDLNLEYKVRVIISPEFCKMIYYGFGDIHATVFCDDDLRFIRILRFDQAIRHYDVPQKYRYDFKKYYYLLKRARKPVIIFCGDSVYKRTILHEVGHVETLPLLKTSDNYEYHAQKWALLKSRELKDKATERSIIKITKEWLTYDDKKFRDYKKAARRILKKEGLL
jgi:hypothetical protein